MSIEADSAEHETEVQTANDALIKRLDAMIFLLEIIANADTGSTLDMIGD